MGNPKQKWTAEEEAALRAGVAKHGTGKWKVIRSDPQFNQLVFARSNAALKDKWRSLCAANVKENPGDTPAAPLPTAQTSPSVATSSKDASVDIDTLDSSRYNTMIFEALSGLNDLNGSDSGAIANFIEKRHEVPQNFKRMLTQRLGTLVQQEKLEKVQNLYRIKNDTVLDKRTLAPRSEEAQPNPIQSIGYLDEAAESAARLIAEAENSSFLAAESMKEAERVSRLAEEMEALLQFARDCLDQCSDGEVLLRD